MSGTRCELVNHLLIPLMTIVPTVYFLNLGVLEFYLLCGYAAYVTVSHVYFGVSVVSSILNLVNMFFSVDIFCRAYLSMTSLCMFVRLSTSTLVLTVTSVLEVKFITHKQLELHV